MARVKENVMVSMNIDTHSKLMLIAFIEKYKFGNNKASMSGIINDALDEYFENHRDRVDRAMKEVNDAWRNA